MREQVELDAWVTRLVERGSGDTVRICGAGAVDGQVVAERVALRAVRVGGGVQGDDLVPQDVVAGRDVLGDPHQPTVVVVREDVSGP